MYKKKEIFIIIAIIIITLFLALLPMIVNSDNKEEEPVVNTKDCVNITIKGELLVPGNPLDEDTIVNYITIEFKSGVTYGEIMNTISNYFTPFSIVDGQYLNRYYNDTTINILSSYVVDNDNTTDDVNKININTASIDELVTLYGIGPKRAQIIIEQREKKAIQSYLELKELLGVSDAIIQSIEEKTVL